MQPVVRISEDEYLAQERLAQQKHELLNGQVLAMAGASPRHVALVSNLVVALGSRLRGSSCRPMASDLRIYVPATGLYTYPDLSVLCGEPARHPKEPSTVLNPTVLVEVLSDSTEAYDRGAKFAHYRTIETLRTYVMVNQRDVRVERYDRMEDGDWRLHESLGLEGQLVLPELDVTVPLSEIYEALPME